MKSVQTHPTVASYFPAWAKKGSGFSRDLRAMGLELAKDLPLPPPASAPGPVLSEASVAPYRIPNTFEVVLVDGFHVPELCRLEGAPRTLLTSLQDALNQPSELVEMHLGRHAGDSNVVSANTTFVTDGLVLDVSPGMVVSKPVHLLAIATGKQLESHHVRTLVVGGSNSQLELIESYVGLASAHPNWTTSVTEIVAGPGSRVSHVRIQRDSLHAHHDAHLAIREGRDAVVEHLQMNLGGAKSDSTIDVVLLESGAEVQLDGLLLATGQQQSSLTTHVDHAAPHTTSRELVKAVLDGNARGSFVGNVKVRNEAQQTNAAQTNRNLLLSDGAKMDSTPQLEIFADDVKCSHGSTIGQLREDALFFLKSRGIGPEKARLILTQAFAEEVLARGPAELRGRLDDLLAQWFACRNTGVRP